MNGLLGSAKEPRFTRNRRMANEQMTVTFSPTNTPAGKLADAELHFHEGPSQGLS